MDQVESVDDSCKGLLMEIVLSSLDQVSTDLMEFLHQDITLPQSLPVQYSFTLKQRIWIRTILLSGIIRRTSTLPLDLKIVSWS